MVDNASSDEAVDKAVKKFPGLKIIRHTANEGVAAGWNAGVGIASSQPYIFITQDVTISEGFQSEIEAPLMTRSRVAVVGALLLYPGSRIVQHAGGKVVYPRFVTRHIGRNTEYEPQNHVDLVECDYVTGAVFACRPDVYRVLGGFDAAFFPAYYEDVDFCLRARQLGWEIVVNPRAMGYHRESSNLGVHSPAYKKAYTRNRVLCAIKHLPADQFGTAFVDSERMWLAQLAEKDRVLVQSYYQEVIMPELHQLFLRENDQVRAQLIVEAIGCISSPNSLQSDNTNAKTERH